jgi:Fe-Mn family superoxide dismutase
MVCALDGLAYKYDALEPNFDAQTMHLHHDKHRAAYVNKLNSVLSEAGAKLGISLDDFAKNIAQLDVPAKARELIKFNGGGHYNHALFWNILTPGGSNHPSGKLFGAMDQTIR